MSSSHLTLSLALLCACQPVATSPDLDSIPSQGPSALMTRLAGLWSGPATGTPLGAFPFMNMDLRAASPKVLFSRADLDADNNLRFAFAMERHVEDVLTFRNGGYFQGILRDSRALLTEARADSFRFCALDRGCGYIDALFTFSDPTHLMLEVKVKGQKHLSWQAERKESRPTPTPFPIDEEGLPGNGPFPNMPSLSISVTWPSPLADAADVWVLLSQTDCRYLTPADLGCTISRSLMTTAAKNSQGARLTFSQIHPGPYRAIAVLDKARTLAKRLAPQSGDGVSLPNQPITVAASGESTANAAIVLTIP